MKIYQPFRAALFAAILFGCGDDDLVLNKNKDQSFKGSFKLQTSENPFSTIEAIGTSALEISNGRFISTTYVEDLGYGHSAGRLEITESKINFIDTVFKVWPMNILPPKYLNGTYDYRFDGDKLEIGTKLQSGWVEIYALKLKK
jgi:hypothetical protein